MLFTRESSQQHLDSRKSRLHYAINSHGFEAKNTMCPSSAAPLSERSNLLFEKNFAYAWLPGEVQHPELRQVVGRIVSCTGNARLTGHYLEPQLSWDLVFTWRAGWVPGDGTLPFVILIFFSGSWQRFVSFFLNIHFPPFLDPHFKRAPQISRANTWCHPLHIPSWNWQQPIFRAPAP